jgi:hypothetical protein
MVAGATWLGGCQTQSVAQVGSQPREAITFAALAKYPGNAQTSDRARTVAITDPDAKSLTVYNLGDQSIPATALWVNGTFVKQISAIPPKSHVTAKYVELLEKGPGVKSMSESAQVPARVEIQTSDGLYTVQGPVSE